MRTSSWRSRASCGRHSAPPGSAARRAAGSWSRSRSRTRWCSGWSTARRRSGSAPAATLPRRSGRSSTPRPWTRSRAMSRSAATRARSCSRAATGRPARAWSTATSSQPTVFDRVDPMSRLGQEEIFGPLLSVIRVPDYDAAVKVVNQVRYGLSSSIYTRDVNVAFRAMRDFATGIVYVNAGTIGAETHLPFGGHAPDRQRPPRGGPRGPRHLHGVEVGVRRLQRPAPAGPDRQPAMSAPGHAACLDHRVRPAHGCRARP